VETEELVAVEELPLFCPRLPSWRPQTRSRGRYNSFCSFLFFSFFCSLCRGSLGAFLLSWDMPGRRAKGSL